MASLSFSSTAPKSSFSAAKFSVRFLTACDRKAACLSTDALRAAKVLASVAAAESGSSPSWAAPILTFYHTDKTQQAGSEEPHDTWHRHWSKTEIR